MQDMRSWLRLSALACTAALAIAGCGLAAAGSGHAAGVPSGLPGTLQIGADAQIGSAADLASSTGAGMRYEYLPGPVNGPGAYDGWQKYEGGGGRYVSNFLNETIAANQVPVLTLYTLLQSLPGATYAGQPGEDNGDKVNLRNKKTMKAYFKNARLMFKLAGRVAPHRVIAHIEPDLWGYLQTFSKGDQPKTVKAQVASTGMPELKGLPNDARGFAKAFVRLRDRYAKNVLLAWQVSEFGAQHDIATEDLDDAGIATVAQRVATFYKRLHAPFDLFFHYQADRDFGEAKSEGNDAAVWTPDDFARDLTFLNRLKEADGAMRVVLFQLPMGNTVMRAMNNTPYHWQDNRVQWFLGDGQRAHLQAYVDAGVIGLLFGLGQATSTCACDRETGDHHADGVTNPAPISGNNTMSYSADDDGGYFRRQAKAFTSGPAIQLP